MEAARDSLETARDSLYILWRVIDLLSGDSQILTGDCQKPSGDCHTLWILPGPETLDSCRDSLDFWRLPHTLMRLPTTASDILETARVAVAPDTERVKTLWIQLNTLWGQPDNL